MGDTTFITLCKKTLMGYINSHMDATDNCPCREEDIFVVWLVKALQNNKGLFSTTRPDGLYYELTYNGDKDELYVDVYKKWENVCVKAASLS